MTLPRIKGTDLATLAMTGAIGVGMLAAALRLQEATYKSWVILIGIAIAPTVLAVVGRAKEVLLFGWVFSLTYNRQYFVFEPLVGYHGTEGPYVLLSDVCLAGLFGLWLYERIMRRPPSPVRSAPLWPWYLPFATVCFLSIFGAARPDWAAFEMLRIVKMGLVLLYVRHNFGRKEWYVTLAALGSSACFQSAVAIKEMVTGKLGVIGLSQPEASPEFVEHFAEGAFTGGVRGTGTMAHPPYLSCYLLLVIPVLLAVSLSTARRRRAWAAAGAFLLACGGLAATLSRAPWLLACLQMLAVFGVLVLLRLVSLQRALAAVILGSGILLIALVPFREKVIKRFTGDFKE